MSSLFKQLDDLHMGRTVTIRGVTVEKADGDISKGGLCVEVDWRAGRILLGRAKYSMPTSENLFPVEEVGRILFC